MDCTVDMRIIIQLKKENKLNSLCERGDSTMSLTVWYKVVLALAYSIYNDELTRGTSNVVSH